MATRCDWQGKGGRTLCGNPGAAVGKRRRKAKPGVEKKRDSLEYRLAVIERYAGVNRMTPHKTSARTTTSPSTIAAAMVQADRPVVV